MSVCDLGNKCVSAHVLFCHCSSMFDFKDMMVWLTGSAAESDDFSLELGGWKASSGSGKQVDQKPPESD